MAKAKRKVKSDKVPSPPKKRGRPKKLEKLKNKNKRGRPRKPTPSFPGTEPSTPPPTIPPESSM